MSILSLIECDDLPGSCFPDGIICIDFFLKSSIALFFSKNGVISFLDLVLNLRTLLDKISSLPFSSVSKPVLRIS